MALPGLVMFFHVADGFQNSSWIVELKVWHGMACGMDIKKSSYIRPTKGENNHGLQKPVGSLEYKKYKMTETYGHIMKYMINNIFSRT